MNRTTYPDPLQAARWDPVPLEPLADLNEEVLAALLQPPVPGLLPAPGSLAWQWQGMAPEARRRAADCPFLLLDLGLAQPALWAGAAGCRLAGEARGVAEQGPARPGLEVGLLRRALLFAWHLARAHRHAGRIALGMSAGVAEALAERRLGALEALAEQRPAWIRPRWADRPALWQAWLAAAAHDRRAELERLQLWGLQSLAAEVLRAQA